MMLSCVCMVQMIMMPLAHDHYCLAAISHAVCKWRLSNTQAAEQLPPCTNSR